MSGNCNADISKSVICQELIDGTKIQEEYSEPISIKEFKNFKEEFKDDIIDVPTRGFVLTRATNCLFMINFNRPQFQ